MVTVKRILNHPLTMQEVLLDQDTHLVYGIFQINCYRNQHLKIRRNTMLKP